ncbi:carnitine operon protein CaiE [uncultured Roseburia sp.]|uniref:Gamma carbonic anhydrase family protein n=1 Tax=Brotonthovivens ammoniilytica TaxID=2981725 RepID=A0ABT2TL90_9FIRM|nr:gamma carbonic anhydrase family protein [Brotonthovivens ammoniilytica]MCU6762970.1 gamma carbonic anhydrase family protein [Brotonthovivens ammoniilytica]SCI95317.1 carnitine operon protein CaiE [uncultured Roseburia sp.]
MDKKYSTANRVFIAESADVWGDVSLEEDSSVWFHSVIRGDHDSIKIGKSSNIQDGCILHADAGFPVKIGDYVTIGHGAVVHGCEISDGALIGMGAIILNGARIGKNSIVGAGALVTQGMVIPDGMVALGSPAKVRRKATYEEITENRKNAIDYAVFGKKYLSGEIIRMDSSQRVEKQ